MEERKAAVQKETERTRCASCGQTVMQPVVSHQGVLQRRDLVRRAASPSGSQRCVSSPCMRSRRARTPTVTWPTRSRTWKRSWSPIQSPQDSGFTEGDLRRRKTTAYTGDDSQPWDLIEQVIEHGYMASSSGDGTAQGCLQPRGAQEIIIPNVKGTVYDIEVSSLVEARPKELQMMKGRELWTICDQRGIQTSGKMADLLERLESFYRGEAVLKKGCTKQFLRLRLGSDIPRGK